MASSGDTAQPSSSVFGRRVTAGDTISERYRVVRELGEGGMGQVLEVEHIALGKHFALKLVRPDRWDETLDARFRREARALAQVNSPRVAQVTDFGVDPDRGPFYVMELIDGVGLDVLIEREGRLSRARGLELARGIALALLDVHAAGIVHRDIKPSNIGICRGPVEVRLLDFGLAASIDDRLGSRITETQRVVGSMPYMAPEQFHNAKPSVSMDLWALGVVLFEMWTGRLPFDASSAAALIHQILSAPPPPLDGHEADGSGVLTKLLAKDPAERPKSAEEALALLASAPPEWSDPVLGAGKVAALWDASSGLADTVEAESVGTSRAVAPPTGRRRVAVGVTLGTLGLSALLLAWWMLSRTPVDEPRAVAGASEQPHAAPPADGPPSPAAARPDGAERAAEAERPSREGSDEVASGAPPASADRAQVGATRAPGDTTEQEAASAGDAPAELARERSAPRRGEARREAAQAPRRPDVTIMPVEPAVRGPEVTPRQPEATIMPVGPTLRVPEETPREPSPPPGEAWTGGIIERSQP